VNNDKFEDWLIGTQDQKRLKMHVIFEPNDLSSPTKTDNFGGKDPVFNSSKGARVQGH